MGWIVVSAFAFGVMPVFAHVAYRAGMDPITVLAFRFLIASMCMAPILWRRRSKIPKGRQLGILILLGAVGFVGEALSFFYALKYAAAGIVALLLFLYPAMVAVLSAILFKEPFGLGKMTALGMALCGVALTVGPSGSSKPVGIMLGVTSAVVYACFVLGSGYMSRFTDARVSTAIIIMSTAVVLCALMLLRGPQFPTHSSGWIAAVAMGTISTVGAILTFFLGLEKIGAVRASTVATIEPIITTVAASTFLGEQVHSIQLLGGAFILGGVIVLIRFGKTGHLGSTQNVV
jgi:drug/metabolite transporter (DMT)-like permease